MFILISSSKLMRVKAVKSDNIFFNFQTKFTLPNQQFIAESSMIIVDSFVYDRFSNRDIMVGK